MPDDRIPIIDPSGRPGTILRSELPKALASGFKQPTGATGGRGGAPQQIAGRGGRGGNGSAQGASPSQTTPVQPPDTMLDRALRGTGRGLDNIPQGVMGAAQLASEMYGPGIMNSAKPALINMAQGSADQYAKIGETLHDPYLAEHPIAKASGVVGHVLGMTPAIGPWAANMGEQIGKGFGDPEGDAIGPIMESITTLAGGEAVGRLPELAHGTARVMTQTGKTFEEFTKQKYEKALSDYRGDLADAAAKHAEAVQKVGQSNAAMDAAYELEKQSIKDKHVQNIAKARQTYLDRENDYIQKMNEYLEGKKTAEQVFDFDHQQGPEFEKVAKQAQELADSKLPKTFKNVKAANDARWNAFRLSVGDVNVPQTPVFEAIADAEDKILAGSHEKIALFREMLKDAEDNNPLNSASVFRGAGREGRGGGIKIDDAQLSPAAKNRFLASLSEEERSQLGGITEDNPVGDVPFDEARRTYTALNRAEQKALNGGHGEVYRAIKSVKDTLEKQITDVVPENLRPQLEALKQDYSQFAQDWYSKKSPIYKLMRSATDQQRIALISGQYSKELASALDRYKSFGAEPGMVESIRNAKQFVDRMKVPRTKPPEPVTSAQGQFGIKNPEAPTPKQPPTFEPPPPPKPPTMYEARLEKLWQEFEASMGASRAVGDNPIQRWRLMNGLYRRAMAKFLADEARRRWIAGQVPRGSFVPVAPIQQGDQQ